MPQEHARQTAAKPAAKRVQSGLYESWGNLGLMPAMHFAMMPAVHFSNLGQCHGKGLLPNPRRQSVDVSTTSFTPLPALLTHFRQYPRNLHM